MLNMIKDPEKEKQHMAAVKAWQTIRIKRIEKIKSENESIDDYNFSRDLRNVAYGAYKINPPLIKPSKLTYVEKGGVGKELSDGWALNYAVGCNDYFPNRNIAINVFTYRIYPISSILSIL